MPDKLREIRDTTSDAVSIIRELGSPGVQESLTKILETAKTAKEIIDAFKTPEFVKNIENFRLIAESVQNSSMRIENAVGEIKQSGILEHARDTIRTANEAFGSAGEKGFGEISDTLKGTLISITELADELRAVLATSKESGTLRNARTAITEASDVYKKISDSPQ